MNKHYTSLLFCCFVNLFLWHEATACGYNWVSDCSSQVHLRINGTLDSFNIADCPSGYDFNGIQLGNLQNLVLADTKTITWESCQNNVSSAQLKYRVYEQGFPGGAWQSLSLQEYRQVLDGPYTTRYRHAPSNISLTNGLVEGKTYTIEVYLQAEVDTIGDDFIPEASLLRNNNGLNYTLSFTYGGPAAPPISLLAHKTEPSCFGDNNGKIAVSAYGNLTGVFYQWSNINLNFYQQNDIGAGTYSITVSNFQGQSAVQSIQLGQPDLLQSDFINVQSVGCNNSPGTAAVIPGGGTAPYRYTWENGQQTQSATFPFSADWHVTITDAHNCVATNTVFIANNSPQPVDITGNLTYNCSAAAPAGWVVAHTAAINPSFSWVFNGATISTDDSCYVTVTDWIGGTSGTPVLPTLTVTDVEGCQNAQPMVQVSVVPDTMRPMVQIAVTEASAATASDGQLSLDVTGSQAPYTLIWNTGDTSSILRNLIPGIYCCTVTGNNGCSVEHCATVSFTTALQEWPHDAVQLYPNPVGAGDWLTLVLPNEMLGSAIQVAFFDSRGDQLQTKLVSDLMSSRLPILTPAAWHNRVIFIHVTGQHKSCSRRIIVR